MKKQASLMYLIMTVFFVGQAAVAHAQIPLERRHKVVYLAERAESLSQTKFTDHLTQTAAPLLQKMPGLEGLVLNLTTPQEENAPYDLVMELWFANEAAYQQGLGSPEGKRAYRQLEQFLKEPGKAIAFTESNMIHPPVRKEGFNSSYKRVWLATHNPIRSMEAYQLIHLRDYAPIAIGIPGFRGYTLHFATKDDPNLPADIMVLTWFDTLEDFQQGMKSENVQLTSQFSQDLVGDSLISMEVAEYVVIPPPVFAFH